MRHPAHGSSMLKETKRRRVSQPLERQALSHSYRHALETFYLALQDADKQLKKPHHITQHMGCETAIKALVWPSYKSGYTMVTDADLIVALARLKSTTQHKVTEELVMGHASRKKKNTPKTITSL